MLNPTHLRTLTAVLRSGSFAAAGRRLGYTGSAVSQQMSALETDSGLVLFERTAHGSRPTVAAELLAEHAGESLGALASLEDAVREIASGTRGRLGLGSFPTASEALVPKALARYAAAFDRVEVRFEDGEPSQLVPRILEGDLDVAVVYRYDLVPPGWSGGLRRVPLFDEELRLLVPDSFDLATTGLRLADLSDAAWISTREGSAGSLAVERACAAVGFAPQIRFRTNDYDVIRSFVRAGLGVAAVPRLAFAGRAGRGGRGGLRVLAADGLGVRRHVEVATAAGRESAAVIGMVRVLQESASSAQEILGLP